MNRKKRIFKFLLVLGLVFSLLAWRNISGYTINPRHVETIKSGQTTKNEIMLMFGEPQEVRRTNTGVVFIYKSFKDAPAMAHDPRKRQISPQSDTPFLVDEDKKIRRPQEKTQGSIPDSTLTVYFKPDGQTVVGHEYVKH
ncbi:MAG: hypothetical protein FJ135_01525 [Deltaproteobacteria bacterium]|nr:hypothetical protein [Deltaproteobacteria bacterium]